MGHQKPSPPRVPVDPKAGLNGKELNTLKNIVKYCLKGFLLNSTKDIKVYPQTQKGGPKHILTQTQSDEVAPKKVQQLLTFSCGQEHGSYTQNVFPPLGVMASQSEDDRRFCP
ncbi:hypothetical protein GWK47_046175 [Chionoecetes opilio]|uniref:Uncharacterized protein n=1 Tax=Chionoecetes opilio TaxID=41210 RepID=A0A8J4YEV9_CHIOP|nr:hypothetical protein GWK47_046175 [Chionoecetes opilio]